MTLLESCRWPDLREPHATALREAVTEIIRRYSPTGIVAAGTVLRGVADAASDLDVVVIHRAPERQRVQKFFAGVATEIFVNPPWTIRRYFVDEHGEGRPQTAHMLATGRIVLATDPLVEQLVAEAREWLERTRQLTPQEKSSARYMAATAYEDALDVLGRDPAAAALLLGHAVSGMLHYRFLGHGRFVPRDKDLVSELEALDAATGELARRFYTTADVAERAELAGRIADRTIGGRGFFEWESALEPAGAQIYGIDHVQVAIPKGGEVEARRFYGVVLELREVVKPPHLAARGGVWFEAGEQQLHLGVDPDFRAAGKAHPALLVRDLPRLIEKLEAAGTSVVRDARVAGYERVYVADPFGNRVELTQRVM